MQHAFNLAWKLALVWHGRAAPSLLDTHSPERSAVGDQVLRNACNMMRVAMVRNPLLQQTNVICCAHVKAVRPAASTAAVVGGSQSKQASSPRRGASLLHSDNGPSSTPAEDAKNEKSPCRRHPFLALQPRSAQ